LAICISENNALTAQWDFSDAAWGGNSLKVSGNLPANQPIDLMLYKTKLGIFSPIDTFFKTNVFYKSATIDSNAKLILIFADEPTQKYEFAISGGIEFGNGWIWNENLMDLSFSTREIAAVGFRFESATAIANYSINFGGLEIGSLTLLGTSQAASKQHFVTVSYPLENKQLRFTVDWLQRPTTRLYAVRSTRESRKIQHHQSKRHHQLYLRYQRNRCRNVHCEIRERKSLRNPKGYRQII
jgi:hypothetical protein